MTLSNYNSNENADFNSGEMILSNYDFNETANYEPSESEDIYILIPDITSMICDHIIMKFYYRKYMLKKKNKILMKCLGRSPPLVHCFFDGKYNSVLERRLRPS